MIRLEKHFYTSACNLRASLVPQLVKNPPAVQDTRVWTLIWEDALEQEVATHSLATHSLATHSSILAWEIPWTEEIGRL